ncbi:putative signal transducing protein [Thermodesulfobacteriota bacterium]
MFCPKCKAEYREGFFKCADCKINLVPELPPEPEQYIEYEYLNLVNIETYYNRHDAELAKGFLSVNGINAFVFGDDSGGVSPHRSFALGVQLKVKEEDVEKAKRFLSEIKKPNNTLEPTPSKNTFK